MQEILSFFNQKGKYLRQTPTESFQYITSRSVVPNLGSTDPLGVRGMV